MTNDDFIMLRSLNKEDYEEGAYPLWKRRKHKWYYDADKILQAIDICEKLFKKGLLERNFVTCGLCGGNHLNKYRYKINNNGIKLILINKEG